jgi:hypothetical protein
MATPTVSSIPIEKNSCTAPGLAPLSPATSLQSSP